MIPLHWSSLSFLNVPDDIRQQWQEAQANRRMQFKVGNVKSSEIHMLTGTLKADWIQLPDERYLDLFPTLFQGVIGGVFKIKGASPWAITRGEVASLCAPSQDFTGALFCTHLPPLGGMYVCLNFVAFCILDYFRRYNIK